MLVAQGLRKSYRNREIVKDFGLTLDAGEVVGLLGPNGAGKTTCFYMIVGLVPADAGSIVLDGNDISNEPMYMRSKFGVGYLPQEPSVFRKLSVRDNIRLVLELRDDLDAAGRDRELNELLEELRGLLAEDFDLSLVGFSDGELDKLLAFVPEGDGEEGGAGGSVPPVTIPEPPRNPASRTGDLWVLGDHRLLCGDSSSESDLDRLLDGATIKTPKRTSKKPRNHE